MRYWLLFSFGLLAILVLRPLPTWAAATCGSSSTTTTTTTPSATTSTTGEAAAADYVPGPDSGYDLEQPFAGEDNVKNVGEYIQLVYRFALGIVGIIAVVLIMFGGLRWMAAAGNESIITEAKEIVTSAVTGLAIALLSYVILAFINPQTLDLSVVVPKIPKPPVTSCPNPPTLLTVNDIDGLAGHSAQACPNAIQALQAVATKMHTDAYNAVTFCPTCTIHVGSAYRTPASQAGMYACYQSCVDQGYMSSNGLIHCKVNGQSTPGGSCTNCVKTAAPCESNHTKGMAFDLYFDGYAFGEAPASAAGDQSKNNGGLGGTVNYNAGCTGSCDAGLFEAQRKLYNTMISTGKFTNYNAEWWHFDYNGACGTSQTGALACTANGSGFANECYCTGSNGMDAAPAYCTGGLTSCTHFPGSQAICGCTATGKSYVFDASTLYTGAFQDMSYLAHSRAPTCQ